MYGTLNNGQLIPAPKRITIGDNNIWNATEGQYRSLGYKPVRFATTPEPPEGYDYEYGWEETEEEIVQTYDLVPIPDDVSPDEALAFLFGDGGES